MENQTRPIQNINLSCEIASFHFKSKKNIDLENLLDSWFLKFCFFFSWSFHLKILRLQRKRVKFHPKIESQ